VIRNGRIEQHSKQPTPRDDLFGWFTEPGRVAVWMGDVAVTSAEPGAEFSVRLPGGHVWDGVVVESAAPFRFVHTLGWRDASVGLASGMSLVTWEFLHDPAGSRIVLLHEHVPPRLLDLHNRTWSRLLARLRFVLAGRTPGPHPLENAHPRS
jgi:uncharacterized protein YndB with AHSA1/START domain